MEETFDVMTLRRREAVDGLDIRAGRNVERFRSAAEVAGYPQLIPRFSTAQYLEQRVHVTRDIGVGAPEIGDLATRVQYGGVVPSAESFSDIGKRKLRQLFRKRHGDLARTCDVARALFRVHLRDFDLVVVGDRFLDVLD